MEIQPGTENELINNMVYINATTSRMHVYRIFSIKRRVSSRLNTEFY